jgi:hypothetical protein
MVHLSKEHLRGKKFTTSRGLSKHLLELISIFHDIALYISPTEVLEKNRTSNFRQNSLLFSTRWYMKHRSLKSKCDHTLLETTKIEISQVKMMHLGGSVKINWSLTLSSPLSTSKIPPFHELNGQFLSAFRQPHPNHERER